MATADLHEFIEYCKNRAGDTLRAIFTYTADEADVLYAREDFLGTYRGSGLEEVRTAAWEIHTTVLTQEARIETLGEYRVTVHTFDRAFVMQFREDDEEGIAVVFDRQIGQNLHEFLLECEQYLQ